MKTDKPLRGKPLLRETFNYVALHQDKHYQHVPFLTEGCGCFAAHAAKIGGGFGEEDDSLFNCFREACGLSFGDAKFIYNGNRTIPQIRTRLVKLCGPKGLIKLNRPIKIGRVTVRKKV